MNFVANPIHVSQHPTKQQWKKNVISYHRPQNSKPPKRKEIDTNNRSTEQYEKCVNKNQVVQKKEKTLLAEASRRRRRHEE